MVMNLKSNKCLWSIITASLCLAVITGGLLLTWVRYQMKMEA